MNTEAPILITVCLLVLILSWQLLHRKRKTQDYNVFTYYLTKNNLKVGDWTHIGDGEFGVVVKGPEEVSIGSYRYHIRTLEDHELTYYGIV